MFDNNARRRGANIFMVKRGCRERSNRDESLKTSNSLHMFENVYAVKAKDGLGPIWHFRVVLAQTPGVDCDGQAANTKHV